MKRKARKRPLSRAAELKATHELLHRTQDALCTLLGLIQEVGAWWDGAAVSRTTVARIRAICAGIPSPSARAKRRGVR